MKDKVSHNAIKKKIVIIFSIIEISRYSQHHVECDNKTGSIHPQHNSMGFRMEWHNSTEAPAWSVDDLLPNEEDGQALFEKAVLYTMQVITENFPSIGSLKKFLPSPEITCPHKSVVVPQKVLFRDEKYTDENIQILRQYIKDCKFTGNPQVQCGNFKNV